MDGPRHYIYIRDDETGDYWSVSWRPVGRDMAKYSCRHGRSYADGIIEHESHYEENGFQFFAADFEPDGFDCLHDDFIGAYFTERDPQSVVSGASAAADSKTAGTTAAC